VKHGSFEIELRAHPGFAETRFVAVALNREQAAEAFSCNCPLVLCVDVPRALYVTNTTDAFRFYDDTE
jgi:hypothetical protein